LEILVERYEQRLPICVVHASSRLIATGTLFICNVMAITKADMTNYFETG
jgi:hypothetical protein